MKTNLTQAETPELGMTKGSLFLFFYPKDVAQYDEVKAALRAFKRFPIVLEGKDVEPVRAFIPKEVLANWDCVSAATGRQESGVRRREADGRHREV